VNNDFTTVQQLSIKEKREFYTSLARLIRSGSALPNALELMARDAPRRVSDLLRGLQARVKDGEPLGDALLRHRSSVTELEATIISAAGQAGKLDHGCDQLARYFDALDRSHTEMRRRLGYPLLVITLVPILPNIALLVTGGPMAFLTTAGGSLAIIYGCFALICIAAWSLNEFARSNTVAEAFLNRIPGLGAVRQKFALARFFATLDAQLEARVNIWEAFRNAARTSDSPRIIAAARRAMPMLQTGERLSEALSRERVLPAEYIRTFRVAEAAGEMDSELTLLATRSEEMAVAALNKWSRILPGVIYGMAVVYVGYVVFTFYRDQWSAAAGMFNQ